MRWASLTQLHKKAYEYSDQFKLSIKFIIIYLSTRLAPVLEHYLLGANNINHSRYNKVVIIISSFLNHHVIRCIYFRDKPIKFSLTGERR
jgi:hypothetical protein